jgi:hypothetical protein
VDLKCKTSRIHNTATLKAESLTLRAAVDEFGSAVFVTFGFEEVFSVTFRQRVPFILARHGEGLSGSAAIAA